MVAGVSPVVKTAVAAVVETITASVAEVPAVTEPVAVSSIAAAIVKRANRGFAIAVLADAKDASLQSIIALLADLDFAGGLGTACGHDGGFGADGQQGDCGYELH